MAESQKTEAPAVDSKGKSSLLDIDIDKDFLGSWKSTSVAEDGMDFDFGPTTGGMKKAFKFDKMDMDFSLDADFDKLSSFKIDMPALDISSPIKKSGNSKERSKETPSGGEHRAKRDTFAFSFDFEEFADLDFDSRKTKIDDKSNKSKDKEEYSNTNDSGGSRGLLAKDIDALKDDDVSLKHPPSTSAAISKVNTKNDDNIKDADPSNKENHLKSVKDDSCLSRPENAQELEVQRTISPEKLISCSLQEPIRESHLSEKISPEPHAQQIVHELHGYYLADNISTEGTFPDVQEGEELRTAVRMVSPSAGNEQNGKARHDTELVPTRSSSSEILSAHMNSQSQEGEMCMVIDDHVLIDHIDGDDTSKADAHLNSSLAPDIEKLAHGELVSKRNADSISELCMDFLDRQNDGTNLVPEKERRTIASYSKYFKRQNESESESQQASLVVNKRMSTLPNNPSLEKREFDSESVESGPKLTGISRLVPKVLSRATPVQTETTEAGPVRGLDNNRECLNADNITTRNENIGPTKEELVSSGSNQSTEHITALRSDHPSSSIEKSKKKLAPNFPNPGSQTTGMPSACNPRNIVVKKNTMSPTKAEMRAYEASPQKVSRTTDSKLKTLNTMTPKGLTSIKNRDQGPELQGNMVFMRNPSVDKKKQTPSLTPMRNKEQGLVLQGNMVFTRNSSAHTNTMKHPPSTLNMKRKTYEESAEIPGSPPSKRLSASSPSSNNIRASGEKIVDKQACQRVNMSEQKSPMLDDSLMEMDISSAIENDGNFEKAEACSKELEDICNMLKKKHEEAKDILVRAIVNNNKLLMLSHPVYLDKIRMVQKFAELLLPK